MTTLDYLVLIIKAISIITGALTLYLALTAFPVWPEAVQRAKLAPMLLEGTRAIALITSHEMRERFHGGYTTIKELWERSSAMNRRLPDGADS